VKKIHIISVIGAHAGLLQLVKSYPDIYITVGVVDHEVSASGFVLPGLGDSGDRLFGTHVPLTHDEATPSRKRSFSQE
jgi:uracil phosphoribosyltransferase